MVTRWAAAVSPTNVWPEYPRPQLVRDQWLNLNGLWEAAITTDAQHPPPVFDLQILVPFPVESLLSGVAQRLDEHSTLWYRRRFTLPAAWRDQQIKLHFGAVDSAATVRVNGQVVGTHRGGFDAFTFDLTPLVRWDATNELLVAVQDPTEGDQPRGKQSRKPEGIFYSPSSGIWQTVWLEPVPALHIQALDLAPDLGAGVLRLRVAVSPPATECVVDVVASFAGREAGRASGAPGALVTVPLAEVHPWSPDSPALYDLLVTLRRGTQTLDVVRSYFGLRDIRLGPDASGRQRLLLNGLPVFQMGVLDQGFWPDGLYTPPSDEAMRGDLETAKRLGFNLVRKHVKVEPERWYYWADRLGLLVWQDMPSGNNAADAGRRQFEMELQRMREQLANHPAIVMWVLFNEGWGQFETERLSRWLKAADPTRVVDNASGWTDAKVGDVMDLHSYPDPLAPSSDGGRARVLGEFGGLGLGLEGHTWSPRTWGYQGVTNAAALTDQYCRMLDKVWGLAKTNGLSAAVYTQLTDVETECNGFLTYDRDVLKVDAQVVNRANRNLPAPPPARVLLPNAQQGAGHWRYSTTAPAEGWNQTAFEASAWREGSGGFGTPETPGALVNTPWDTPEIWLRREFTLPAEPLAGVRLMMHHDDDVEVYVNGVLAVQAPGFTMGYTAFDLSPKAQAALRPGQNLLAVHCHQFGGGQFIDVGLVGENTAR